MSETEVCPACHAFVDSWGVLNSGELVFIHGSSFCITELDDFDRLRVGVKDIFVREEDEANE